MGRKRPRKKTQRTPSRDEGPGIVRLSSEDLIALREARLAAARDQVATLPALIEDLRTLMRAVYPPHVIAVVAGWGLRTGVGPRASLHAA